MFNHSDFVDVGKEFTLFEDLEILNIDDDATDKDEDTMGSYNDIDADTFLLGTQFDVGDDLDNPFCDILHGKFTAKETLSINLL